jgi:transposase
MTGAFSMGSKEQITFEVIEQYRQGDISRKDAAMLLDCSERSIDRKARRIEDKGLIGLKHGNHGRPPKNQTPAEVLAQVETLLRSRYFDFNMTHSREMLIGREQLHVGYQTLRRLCHEKGLVKRKKKIRRKNKYHRERMASEGMMLQMDGSHHCWNGKDKWCLIAMIDDATSEIPYAEFFPSEDTLNCLKVLENVIASKGIPRIIYVDKAGWFGGNKRQEFSQFLRACEELGIQVIFANSPEAKGRIERAWQTFQDRLIPELRLNECASMEAANTYIWQKFLPDYWNRKNTVAPRKKLSRYQTIPDHMDITQICCLKENRQVRNDLTILYENGLYRIENKLLGAMRGKKVEIRTYWDKSWEAFYGRINLILKHLSPPRIGKGYIAS